MMITIIRKVRFEQNCHCLSFPCIIKFQDYIPPLTNVDTSNKVQVLILHEYVLSERKSRRAHCHIPSYVL